MSHRNEVIVHETAARGSGEKFGLFLFAFFVCPCEGYGW